MTPRHTLDRQTVDAIKTRLRNRTRGFSLVRARYTKQFKAYGFTFAQALDAYADCFDIAELEHNAEQGEAR